MKNIDFIKQTLVNTILNMSEDTLFEFLSDYEDENSYFPPDILFNCKMCHTKYGDCQVHISGDVDYNTCKERFHKHCDS